LYKTADAGADALMAEVARTHPYDTPEIARIPVSDVHPPYMAWLASQAR
ncbi:MAG: divalent cation tolerance protein CutA, partial [Nitrosopumilaceae archaeon]|nr:divalent cation tolerance protein CutA [Nitrosopumilaceae archaeon]